MSARNPVLGGPTLPQVNLLPPEVRSARTVRRVKGILVLSAAVSLLVVAGGYVLGTMEKSRADDDLATAQRDTTALMAEQQQYAAVPRVQQALDRAETARMIALAGEVLWSDYLGAVDAVIGPNISMETVVVQQVLPDAEVVPLDPAAVAVLTFTGRAATVPDGPAVADALDALPGLDGARVDVFAIGGDESNQWWNVTISVRVTADALSNRWLPADDAGDASTEDEGE